MKRQALIRHLKKNGFLLMREGKRHSVYLNPSKGKTSTVPRHTEIVDILARKICKDLDVTPL